MNDVENLYNSSREYERARKLAQKLEVTGIFLRHYTRTKNIESIEASKKILPSTKSGLAIGFGVYLTDLITPRFAHEDLKEVAKIIGLEDEFEKEGPERCSNFLDIRMTEQIVDCLEVDDRYPHQFCVKLPKSAEYIDLTKIAYFSGVINHNHYGSSRKE